MIVVSFIKSFDGRIVKTETVKLDRRMPRCPSEFTDMISDLEKNYFGVGSYAIVNIWPVLTDEQVAAMDAEQAGRDEEARLRLARWGREPQPK